MEFFMENDLDIPLGKQNILFSIFATLPFLQNKNRDH